MREVLAHYIPLSLPHQFLTGKEVMTLAYTPELSDYHSGTLRRIAWALGKPMTKTLHTLFDSLDLIIEPGKVCEKCKDRSLCDELF